MDNYPNYVEAELMVWLLKMKKPPGLWSRLTHGTQQKINSIIPEKVHKAISVAIENMVKAVLTGSSWIIPKTKGEISFKEREDRVRKRIKWYRNTASVEGGLTGAGGILLGLADFPAFLTIKVKMLFDIAALYGIDTKDYQERLFLLYVFQLAFSSQTRRNELIGLIENWESFRTELPDSLDQFDWKTFQLDYRDYIDLAKLAQLVPIIGAPVGAIANYRLTEHLGEFAMNSYRLRLWKAESKKS
ncbi:EcsC family protein [Algoriphagus boseongensis]|uniref:EcsC family protein n=1 Tax=Algoriphagus boseongensis TaxID=1442587 RepID=A0A4R6T4K6_9BACT|nr:EcsC family protein [Algoriphagus boseongensis]TDQ13544.1 EcsC family protein [Algoriphagus boseongensis]